MIEGNSRTRRPLVMRPARVPEGFVPKTTSSESMWPRWGSPHLYTLDVKRPRPSRLLFATTLMSSMVVVVVCGGILLTSFRGCSRVRSAVDRSARRLDRLGRGNSLPGARSTEAKRTAVLLQNVQRSFKFLLFVCVRLLQRILEELAVDGRARRHSSGSPADPECHQSPDAYGQVAAVANDARFTQLACTGASYLAGITGAESFPQGSVYSSAFLDPYTVGAPTIPSGGAASVPAEFGEVTTDGTPSNVNSAYTSANPNLVLLTLGADDLKFVNVSTVRIEWNVPSRRHGIGTADR